MLDNYIVSYLAFDTRDPDLRRTSQSHEWNDNLSPLKMFTLGYYYETLWPLLNASQRAEPEGHGYGYDMSCPNSQILLSLDAIWNAAMQINIP